jgi:hypothetical protein
VVQSPAKTAVLCLPAWDLRGPASCGSSEKGELGTGITIASWRGVPETPMRLVPEDPIVMWRMRRADGLLAHAVIGPRSDRAVVVWFINGRPLGYRDFGDWTSALRWSDQMQAQNWAAGWRLDSE